MEIVDEEPIGYISERANELLVEKKQAHGQIRNYRLFTHDVALYPRKPWVGLTDAEYQELHIQMGEDYFYQDYGRAVEAKLKELNDNTTN